MDIKATKIELVQLLLQTEKESILKKIQDIFKKEEADWWNELSDKQKNDIEESIQSLDEGKSIPHSEVQERMAKYIKSKVKNNGSFLV